MAKTKIELTDVAKGGKILVNGTDVYPLTDADVQASIASAAGVGTFNWTAATNKATFVGDAALSGEIEVTIDSSKGSLESADFSKATAGVQIATTDTMLTVTSGAGNDTITSAQNGAINTGAGNDLVSITAGENTVTMGAGADTLEFTGGKVTVDDYNYYEGDVIKSSSNVTLSSSGVLNIGADASNVSVTASQIAVQDNWYAAKVDNNGTVVDYFTAVAGNNQDVTKDLSKSTVANKVDATGAKTANITLGKGSDTVSLANAGVGADTIKIGKASNANTIKGFDAKEDVFAIDGVKLAEIDLGTANNNVELRYGQSTVDSGLVTTQASVGSLNINDGSQTRKLAYNNQSAGGIINYKTSSDADWFYSTDNTGKTTLEVGSTTHLHDITKYKNITNIKVAADAKLDAPISLTGAIGVQNTIDASAAKVGTAIWGFSDKDDSIKLGAGQDTVWFGAGDGNDTITGFKYGTASDSDVLYLKDTQTLKDIDVAGAKFTVGKVAASVNANTAGSDVAQIKLADEKTYKVAGEFKNADTVDINTDAIDGLDYYAFAGDKKAKAVNISGSKDWIFHSLYTDFYTTGATIATIDASKATGNVTLAAAASIQGGAGTSNIWTYQANSSASVTGGDGTDIIWFAENADKDVHVSSFDADKDIVKFATAQSLKEIAEGYTFADGGTNTAITGVNNTDSVLTLNNISGGKTINLVDGNDKAYKALVNVTTGASNEFSTDVNIYAGMTTLNAGGSVEGTVAVRLGKESRGLSSDTYFIDDSVTKFDGSKSNATFWVAGNANKSNTIIGGMTENYLYGGGASADELKGSVLAKDTFYFGTGDGVDTISEGVDTKDTIALWNISDADIANVKVSIDTEKNTVSVSFKDSSTLNITDANAVSALKNGLTFTSASQTAYTYNSETKTLVKKA